ncbi:MAG TPA: hemerythrin domain-containing protein [Burkholderiales bacterium]
MARTTKPRPRSDNPSRETAIDILTADHRKVSEIFAQYEKTRDDDLARKQELATTACTELTIHAQIEEELFYPALRDVLSAEELINEAEVEHGSIKKLIAALESSTPEDRLYDANLKVLSEYVKHHVEEEQDEIFPKARRAKELDLVAMGDEIRHRKVQLRDELGLEPETVADAGVKAVKKQHSTTSRHI